VTFGEFFKTLLGFVVGLALVEFAETLHTLSIRNGLLFSLHKPTIPLQFRLLVSPEQG
jgi:hypothetical protein